MSEHLIRAFDLVSESLDSDDGEGKIAVCEEAVRQADLSGDLRIQYFAREHFVRACAFGGEPEKALVTFSWLLAQFDESPSEFSEWSVLWKYKWIIGLIYEFPQIPKSRVYEMLGDFERRAIAAGYGRHAVYNFHYRFERFCGNRDKAIEIFSLMGDQPRDDLSNCPTCSLNERAEFAFYCGDDDWGVRLLHPILQGEKKCATVPQKTFASVLLPLVRLGQHDAAFEYHRTGYAMIRQNKAFLEEIADHMIFLAVVGSPERALEIFKTHVEWLERSTNLNHHFLFCSAAVLLFVVLGEQKAGDVELRLPRTVGGSSSTALYSPAELVLRFLQRARELGDRFDERNETDFFAKTLSDAVFIGTLCARFPVTKDSYRSRISCPDCEEHLDPEGDVRHESGLRFEPAPEVGDVLRCASCAILFEIVNLNPVELEVVEYENDHDDDPDDLDLDDEDGEW